VKHLAFLAADSYITVKTQAGVVKTESREYTETLPGAQPAGPGGDSRERVVIFTIQE